MKVLALDFDGVISDSAPEAFVVALRSYVGLRADASPRLHRACADVERALASRPPGPSPLALLVKIAATDLYSAFVDAMPLGNRAEDFGVELAAIDRGVALADQRAFDAHKRELEASAPAFCADFHTRFYRERDAFAARDIEAWRALLGPYPAFVALLRRRAREQLLAIATAKDRPATLRLLAGYGIADLFDAAHVLDKDTGTSKRAHLALLHARTAVPYSEIAFVDDKLNHLEDVAPLGVRCVLAAWGYNSERERSRARELGFEVCGLADAERVLFGARRAWPV